MAGVVIQARALAAYAEAEQEVGGHKDDSEPSPGSFDRLMGPNGRPGRQARCGPIRIPT